MLPNDLPHTRIASHPQAVAYESLKRFATSTLNVQVHDRSFSILAVADVNVLVDAITPEEFARDERLPYWAELWPSSIALGRFCIETVPREARVLEIGCGLGLSGLCAAHAGARVLMTDYDGDALTFARYNCEHNLPPDIFQQNICFQRLDWRDEVPMQEFDLVLGSDVLYERSHFGPIARLTSRTLSPGGIALFTDPHRSTQPEFIAIARQTGFNVTVEEIPGVMGSSVSLVTLRHVAG